MTDPDSLAKAFVGHYYQNFDTNRQSLASLYSEESMLTFEGQQHKGTQAIITKLTSLPFTQCTHNIASIDTQPSLYQGGLHVFVTGSLQPEGESNQISFSQVFHLVPVNQSYMVSNDIFRLNLR